MFITPLIQYYTLKHFEYFCNHINNQNILLYILLNFFLRLQRSSVVPYHSYKRLDIHSLEISSQFTCPLDFAFCQTTQPQSKPLKFEVDHIVSNVDQKKC